VRVEDARSEPAAGRSSSTLGAMSIANGTPATSFWLVARIVLLAVALLSADAFIRTMPGNFSQPSWPFLFELIGIVAFGVVFVLSLQKVNPRAPPLRVPRWTDNPFVPLNPLSVFHFNALLFISLGIGCLVLGLLRTPRSWVWELPLGIGIGAWIGVKLMSSYIKDDPVE
jgi:hypothetical protein